MASRAGPWLLCWFVSTMLLGISVQSERERENRGRWTPAGYPMLNPNPNSSHLNCCWGPEPASLSRLPGDGSTRPLG